MLTYSTLPSSKEPQPADCPHPASHKSSSRPFNLLKIHYNIIVP